MSATNSTDFPRTERTTVRRKPDRASYDRDLIYSILDEAFVCHLGLVHDGQPFVMPTNYVRDGDRLLLHGSTAGRMMRALAGGAPFCLTVTLLDAMVFAPTAVGHSVNYRSVVVLGKGTPLEDLVAKRAAMRAFVNHVFPGVSPSDQELKGTMVVQIPLGEVSAKIRTGFAVDDEKDYGAAWTGIVPMKWTAQTPLPDPRGNPSIPIPEAARTYSRPL